MSFVLTYNSLIEAVKNYLERKDEKLLDSIPLFIMLGQTRMARDLKILGVKTAIRGNFLIPNNNLLAKPVNWLSDSEFNISVGPNLKENKPLPQRSISYCKIFWPNALETDEPKYYANDYNYDYWYIVPTPAVAYPYEALYYGTPQFIDETISTNFFTENIPNVFLYATLLETASYLKDDQRIAVWKQYYADARAAVSEEEMKRVYDAFSKRGS